MTGTYSYDTPNLIELDGEIWGMKYPIKSIETCGDVMVIEFSGMEFINQCDHCHRGDLRPVVARGWDDAKERGLIGPPTDFHSSPGLCIGCSAAMGRDTFCRGIQVHP